MRSFSFFATLAAAALSLAAPVVDPLPKLPGTPELPTGNALDLTKGPLIPKARHEQTCAEAIVDITAKVALAIQPLTYITKDNCTVDNIKPHVVEVKTILEGGVKLVADITVGVVPSAQAGINGILSGNIASIFSIGGSVLAVVDIAGLLAVLLKVVFVALGAVLKVVADADKDVVVALLCEVAVLVVAMLKIVLPLVGGLVAALLPLCADIVVVLKALGILHLFAPMGLQFQA
ncbi:hypothetical protein AAF712_009961 [Marasmius tenuissimus]|uniref:Uncharacterized protein n=1 Tax=Marasmius tenuissimus TaxID=585030 RepID=A0ABR2ZNE5_9AGAR